MTENLAIYRRNANLTKPQKTGHTACFRCGGTGHVAPFGVCFRCGGATVDPTYKEWIYPADYTDEQIQALEAKRNATKLKAQDRANAKRIEKQAAQYAANLAAYPALAGLDDDDTHWGFLGDIWEKAHKYDLTPAQAQAVTKGLAERAEAQAATQAALEQAQHLTYLGTVGEKLRIEGTVEKAFTIDTKFGLSRLLVIVDADGNRAKAFTSATFAWNLEDGDKVTLDATVKDHEEYEGLKETLITRPKLIANA